MTLTCDPKFGAEGGVNEASASGTDPNGVPTTDTDDLTTPVVQHPAISIVKSLANYDDTDLSGDISNGDGLWYQFLVTNTGDVTLDPVSVTDDTFAIAVTCLDTALDPGDSVTCTADAAHIVTLAEANAGEVFNEATASGTDPNGVPTTDTDDLTTPVVQHPAIYILKDTLGSDGDWGDGVFVIFNEDVSWRYDVVNTGDVTLTNVAVTDNKGVDIDCDGGLTNTTVDHIIASMDPGDQVTCYAGPVTNQVEIGTTYENTGKAATTFNSAPVTDLDDSSYTSRPFGMLMTNTELCSLPNDQFRLLFTPDMGKGFKLNATNPGQFYYNMFYVGAGNETVTLTLPYPWVTQGNMPIHMY